MKILLKLLLALVAVVVLAVAALLLLFDPNAYKDELIKLARDKGQVVVAIDGDIGWSLYPNLALSLPALTLDDLQGERIAAVKSADVAVAVLPLLSGRLQMSGITLEGLDLQVPDAAPAESPSADGESASDNLGTSPMPELDIGHIRLLDATIRYPLAQSNQTLILSGVRFEGEDIVSGKAFPADAGFGLKILNADQSLELQLDAELQAQLLLDPAGGRFSAEQLRFDGRLGGAVVGGSSVPLSLAADLQADLPSDRVSVEQLVLTIGGLKINGALTADQLSSALLLKGQLSAAPFDLNALLQTLGQPAVETQDPAVLKQVGFEATLAGPANTLSLKPLKLRLDDSRFEGELSLDLQSGRQRLRLQGDQLNLDRYLPPPAEPAAQSSEANADAAPAGYSKEPVLPVEVLRGLNFELALGLDQLQASGLTLTELELKAQAAAGVIKAERIAAVLYGGRIDNSAVIDASGQRLRTDVRKRVSAVNLGGLLTDLAQVDRFSGVLSLEGRYRTEGNSIHDWVNSLNGDSQVTLMDGRVKGVNLVDRLCQGIRQLKGLPETAGEAPDYTDFSNLSTQLAIKNGVVTTNDLKASMVAAGIGGAGQVSLPAQTLDMRLDLTVLQQVQGEQCQIEEDLHNLALPVRCQGGFFDPPTQLCRPDGKRIRQTLADLTKRKAGDKLQQKLEQKLGDQLQDEGVKNVLKGLFK